MLNKVTISKGEEDVSFGVESLFKKYPYQRYDRFYLWGNICAQEIRTNLQKIFIQETILQTHNGMYI